MPFFVSTYHPSWSFFNYSYASGVAVVTEFTESERQKMNSKDLNSAA
jgi:hypothetical protein